MATDFWLTVSEFVFSVTSSERIVSLREFEVCFRNACKFLICVLKIIVGKWFCSMNVLCRMSDITPEVYRLSTAIFYRLLLKVNDGSFETRVPNSSLPSISQSAIFLHEFPIASTCSLGGCVWT